MPNVRKRVLVIRLSSERQEAIEAGFAKLVGTQTNSILAVMHDAFEEKEKLSHVSPFGVIQPL